jgi:flagellar motility protein MotE (MotC chaperone)
MKTRFRLLPAVIFLAGFGIAVKLGSLWHGVDGVLANAAVAREQEEPAVSPPPATGPTGDTANDEEAANGPGEAAAGGGDARDDRIRRAAAWFDPASVTDAELEVLQRLSERRAALDAREKDIDVRARLLEATEKRIDSKLSELKEIRDTIAALLKQHDAEKDEKMQSLVRIYEAMKPKDAARIFEELEMAVLLDVVERMREARTAPIMANMSPAKAKAMTAALAQRRALPKPDRPDR